MSSISIAALLLYTGCQSFDIEYINETLPVFSLLDVNTTSELYDTSVSSDQFASTSPELVSAWYFGHSTWGYCSGQFGHLNTLQDTLNEEGQAIQIIGVNGIGYENGNERVTEDRDIPWLQDIEDIDAWTQWGVQYRDVYVLDQNGNLRFIYNLTVNNVGEPDNLELLKEAMIGLIE